MTPADASPAPIENKIFRSEHARIQEPLYTNELASAAKYYQLIRVENPTQGSTRPTRGIYGKLCSRQTAGGDF